MNWREDFDESLLDQEALAYLVEYELDDPAAGITQRVITHGLSVLTEKQLHVFKKYVVDEWLNQKCQCGNHSVEGDELIGLWVNDGYCGRCADRMEKDARRGT
ncbi:MAG: hypothetical protein O3C40_04365 [Planctomycetota bacterium]|nr:hypothetical protein [Planctomycetota bacterium]